MTRIDPAARAQVLWQAADELDADRRAREAHHKHTYSKIGKVAAAHYSGMREAVNFLRNQARAADAEAHQETA